MVFSQETYWTRVNLIEGAWVMEVRVSLPDGESTESDKIEEQNYYHEYLDDTEVPMEMIVTSRDNMRQMRTIRGKQ